MRIPKNIRITDAVGKTTAFLSPKSDGLKECYPDCRLNGESTLEFYLPANSEKINELTPECEIYAGGRVYILRKDDAIDTVRDDNNKLWAKVMAVEKWYELDTSYVEPCISNDPNTPEPADLAVIIVGGGDNLSNGAYATGTAAHALYAVLQGSGWAMGIVDVDGIHDLEMEKVSRLELIKKIQNIWGGYLVWDSLNKVVHLRDENKWQPYTGFQIRYKKNLKHITKTQSNKIISKLYPFGKDNLDIASVNNGIKYTTNNSYTGKEYTGTYENQDIDDPQELLEKATAELELICRPRNLYKIKVVDIRVLPEYSHEDFTLGDMADVIDPDIAPDSPRSRIIRHKYNLFQPWKCELDIGDPEEKLAEKLKASFGTSDFINHAFDGTGKLPGIKLVDESVIRDKIASAAIDATKFDTKQIILVEDEWFDNSPDVGCAAWNLHKLYFQGVEYIINAQWTDKKYIVWRKEINLNSYQCYTEKEFDAIKLADDEFVIAVNNDGEHDIAWYSRLARQFIGSAFIADAAIKSAHIAKAQILDAHIANLVANKITAGILSSKDGSTWINIDDGTFNFKDSLIWKDGTLNITSPDIPNKDDVVFQDIPYNDVKISANKGLEVMDNYNRQRVQLGNYTFGKYGLLLKDATGTKTILDEDGMLQSWQEGKVGNVDEYSSLTLNVYIPENTRYISKAILRFKMERFRAYSKSAISTEESTISSQNSVENTISSQNSAEFSTTSAAGGGGTKTTHGGVDVEWIYPDTQPGGEDGHTHTYKRVQSHAHDIILENHTHTIKIPPHQHKITVPPHEHEINIPPHEHEIEYGIFEGELPNDIMVTINGIDYTRYLGGRNGFNEDRDNLDITTLLEKGTWNTIEIGSSTMGRIDASVFIQCFMNTIRNSVILDETYLKTFKIRTGMGLGEVSVAPRRTQLHSNPDMIFEAHVIRGIIEATAKEWRTLDIEGWAQQFIIRGAQSVALAFDGNWTKDEMGKYQFLTDDKPYIFWVNEEGKLFVRLWDEEDTTKELAQDVVKVKALRGWKNVSVSKNNYGLIAAYIKTDGKVYYRNYSNQGSNIFMWEDERQVEEFTGTVKDISLFNTNDYRTGLMIEDSNGKMHWLMTKRNWAGMAIAPERITAKINMNIDFIETTKYRGYCIERVTSKPNIALDFLYASSFNEFKHVENIDDGTGNFGIKVKIKTKYGLYNCLSSEFKLTDSDGVSFNCEDIESISPNEFILTFLDFNNADGEVKLTYTRTNGTNEAGYAFDSFEGTFMPTGLIPVSIPVPEVEVIWNE